MLDLRRRTVTQTDSGREGGVSQPTISADWKTFYNDIPIGFRTYGASYALNNEKVVLASGSGNYVKVIVPTAATGVYNIRLAYEKGRAPSPNGYYFQFTRNACTGSNMVVKPKMRYNTSVSSRTINGKAHTVGRDEVNIFLPAGTAEFNISLSEGTAHITGLLIDLVMAASWEISCTQFKMFEESPYSQGFVDTGGVMLRQGDKAGFKMPSTSGDFYILGALPTADDYSLIYKVESHDFDQHYINSDKYPYGTSQGAHFYNASEMTYAGGDTVWVECSGSWAHIISLICV